MTSWSNEDEIHTPIIQRGNGIAYRDPVWDHHARDGSLVLWRQQKLAQGKGKPVWMGIHFARLRRAMDRLLCQVCAQPAEDTERGTLFLTGNTPRGPIKDRELTTHPPVCLPCAAESVAKCPHLLRGFVAARVAEVRPWGVGGTRYVPGLLSSRPMPLPEPERMSYDDDRIGWMHASHPFVELLGCRPVDLTEELLEADLLQGAL
ncbi:hypothetical protein AB0C77_25225 [Streptomyces sp. NPDC048629]|uniref:hypothetical protein n=1 Tax=Streptomyces sp. NPDC048629 TaxID=3154824 RepID=UPI00343CB9EE